MSLSPAANRKPSARLGIIREGVGEINEPRARRPAAARAASVQATAAPPSNVMNSRRLMLDTGTSSPVGGLGALEDAAEIDAGLAVRVGQARPFRFFSSCPASFWPTTIRNCTGLKSGAF
jgi:hypothetical protein